MVIAGAVMSAISMATSYMQIQNQNEVAESQMDAAVDAANSDYAILNRKQNEVSQQAALEETERMRQGRRERAKINVNIGESGISGIAPIRQQAASFFDQSWDTGIMRNNMEGKIMGVQDEKNKVYSDVKGRINQAKSNTVSPTMAGLQIGGAGVQGFMSGYSAFKK